MGTRSAYRLQKRLYEHTDRCAELYRHWDGYPAEGGADLLSAVVGASSLTDALARLLEVKDAEGKRCYDACVCWENGDLEWRYTATYAGWSGVDGPRRHRWLFDVSNRAPGEQTWGKVLRDATPAEFLALVNRQRAEIRVRMQERGIDPAECPDLALAPEALEVLS